MKIAPPKQTTIATISTENKIEFKSIKNKSIDSSSSL